MELYRQILLNFGMSYLSFQVSIMLSKDQGAPPGHCISRNVVPVLVIDEAHLLKAFGVHPATYPGAV
jgi:hypothetical protein